MSKMFSLREPAVENIYDIWHDREVRFDVHPSLIALRKGEILIDELGSVEDTKGNNGERGQLRVTNLRLTWQSHAKARANLSVGWSCVAVGGVSIKTATSKLRGGSTQALAVSAKHAGIKYEFIFTSLVKANPRLFITAQAVLRSYETSRLYRELKMRGAIIKDKQLILLPGEKVYTRLDGIWNLSSDQGNLGVMLTTSIRLVWFATLAENFNVSVPYTQMLSVRVRDSKFGQALVVEASPRAGGYLLGFKIDDAAHMNKIYQEIVALHHAAYEKPDFGIRYTVEDDENSDKKDGAAVASSVTKARVADDVEIVEDEDSKQSEGGGQYSGSDAFAAYFADGSKEMDRPVVFNSNLGLAIESPPPGLSVEKLWAVT